MYFLRRIKILIKELFWKFNINLSFKNHRIQIERVKYNFSPHKVYANLIPPVELNYNYNSSYFNYKKIFLDAPFKTYFPKILEFQNKYNPPKNKNYFLDLGCGYGPMAIAYMNYLNSCPNKEFKFKYYGVDINKNAINWLKKTYRDLKEFEFLLHETDLERDYLQSKSKNVNTLNVSDAKEVEYIIPKELKFDIQWSWSFFTHLTPSSCDKALNVVSRQSEINSLQFNSWLIIDNESLFSLKSGLANRLLPYDMGEYLTRSRENPLTSTCYKENFIYNVYKKNNLKIIDIQKGKWRGTKNSDQNLNQDLIISQKI